MTMNEFAEEGILEAEDGELEEGEEAEEGEAEDNEQQSAATPNSAPRRQNNSFYQPEERVKDSVPIKRLDEALNNSSSVQDRLGTYEKGVAWLCVETVTLSLLFKEGLCFDAQLDILVHQN